MDILHCTHLCTHLTHTHANTHACTHTHTHTHTRTQSNYVSWFHAGWLKSGIFMDVGTLGHTVCKHFYWDNTGLCVCVCVCVYSGHQCEEVSEIQRQGQKQTQDRDQGKGSRTDMKYTTCVWIWVSVRLSFRGSLVILRSYSWWRGILKCLVLSVLLWETTLAIC